MATTRRELVARHLSWFRVLRCVSCTRVQQVNHADPYNSGYAVAR